MDCPVHSLHKPGLIDGSAFDDKVLRASSVRKNMLCSIGTKDFVTIARNQKLEANTPMTTSLLRIKLTRAEVCCGYTQP